MHKVFSRIGTRRTEKHSRTALFRQAFIEHVPVVAPVNCLNSNFWDKTEKVNYLQHLIQG